MAKRKMPRIPALILTLAVLLAGCRTASPITTELISQPTVPPTETTAGETTVPETTVPEPTIPETTTAETTVPETTAPEETAASTPEEGQDYVLNINTMKFHYPGCGSAKRIKDSNRQDFHGTREELLDRGYDPCGNCKP